jgi:hypothetical protein
MSDTIVAPNSRGDSSDMVKGMEMVGSGVISRVVISLYMHWLC